MAMATVDETEPNSTSCSTASSHEATLKAAEAEPVAVLLLLPPLLLPSSPPPPWLLLYLVELLAHQSQAAEAEAADIQATAYLIEQRHCAAAKQSLQPRSIDYNFDGAEAKLTGLRVDGLSKLQQVRQQALQRHPIKHTPGARHRCEEQCEATTAPAPFVLQACIHSPLSSVLVNRDRYSIGIMFTLDSINM